MLTRVVTGTLAAAIALAAILWREPWGLVAVLALVALALASELAKLASTSIVAGLPACLMLIGLFSARSEAVGNTLVFAGLCWIVAVVWLVVWLPDNRALSIGLFFLVNAGVMPAMELGLERGREESLFVPSLLLLALLPLWVGDSLAYFVGKGFGRHKMAPKVSPNKTWEGAVANLAGCLASAYGIGLWLKIPLSASIAVGLTTGVLGQVGDLLQSRLKRLAGVKDSGSLLPGHGGLLDRLDSFLFSCYPSLLALYLLAPEMFHVKRWPW